MLLSSGDTAVVIKENNINPYAPVVKLLYNSSRQKYEEAKTIDLLEWKTIKIKRTLNSGEASRILSEYMKEA